MFISPKFNWLIILCHKWTCPFEYTLFETSKKLPKQKVQTTFCQLKNWIHEQLNLRKSSTHLEIICTNIMSEENNGCEISANWTLTYLGKKKFYIRSIENIAEYTTSRLLQKSLKIDANNVYRTLVYLRENGNWNSLEILLNLRIFQHVIQSLIARIWN